MNNNTPSICTDKSHKSSYEQCPHKWPNIAMPLGIQCPHFVCIECGIPTEQCQLGEECLCLKDNAKIRDFLEQFDLPE